MDEWEHAAQFRPPAAGTAAEVLALRLATPDIGELAEEAAAKAAADARARQRDELIMANKMAGDPVGHVSRAQAAVAELRGEVDDLEARLDAARGRLRTAAGNLVHWTEQAEEVRAAVARRSDTADLLGPAKAAHAEYVAATRAAIAATAAGTPRQARHPFGGVAVRSEVTCHECQKVGATPEESWLLHNDPCPMDVPDEPTQAELEMFGREVGTPFRPQTERRGHGGYAEIRR